jgi:hypothetical protein
MKTFTFILLAVISFACHCQDVDYKFNPRTGKFDMVRSTQWLNSSMANISFNGNRAVTRSGLPAVNTGDTSLIAWINNYFFPSTSPTATISQSGATSREYMSTGSALSVDLNWSVTRPVACTEISAITVNGLSQTVNPIGEGQSQNGTLTGQSLTRNTNTTYSISVVANDGKSGTASTTINWYWAKYWGAFASTLPPTNSGFSITDADILALTGAGSGTGYALASTRTGNYNGINGAGKYLVFAFPSSWGIPQFVINGLISTAWTKVRDNAFINASGGSTTYQVWVSNTTQASDIAQFTIN